MNKYLLLLFCWFRLLASTEEPHKIVFLISPPRSLSTGFLRMMEARGDFTVYHEPTLPLYHRLNHLTFSHDWFREGTFQSFEEIKQSIYQEDKHVFVKEMSFLLRAFIDEELVRHPEVYFIFLLRNPHHTIISLYSKIGAIVEDFHVAIGYQAAYDTYQKIVGWGARQPLILFSEDLASKPEEVVRAACAYAGIPFDPKALSWKNLGDDFGGHEEWHESKRTDLTQHWHGAAIRSTKFEPLTTYEVDALGHPTFSEVRDLHDRKECEKAYHDNLPYYSFFREAACFMTQPNKTAS